MNTEFSAFHVTTINTQFARAIRSEDETHFLNGCDIALMQEVIGVEHATISRNLGSAGLTLACINDQSGLAIGISDKFKVISSNYFTLQGESRFARFTKLLGLKPMMRERGMLVAQLQDTSGNHLTAITAHPIVCIRFLNRARQIRTMSRVIADNFNTDRLVVGADFNHYPYERRVDRKFAADTKLQRVDNTDPTCLLRNTKHSWLQFFGFKDARLDGLLYRGLIEKTSSTRAVNSDHMALQASFTLA